MSATLTFMGDLAVALLMGSMAAVNAAAGNATEAALCGGVCGLFLGDVLHAVVKAIAQRWPGDAR